MKFEDIIKEYSNKIRYFNYSKRTEEIYVHYVLKFLEKIDKYTQHLTSKDNIIKVAHLIKIAYICNQKT
jgi:hypothetical protein